MKSTGRQIVRLCLLFLLASCSGKPSDNYEYISVIPGDNDGLFIFSFPMDSLCRYDTYFSCRLNPSKIDSKMMKVLVTAISPSGDSFSEDVVFPIVTNVKEIPHEAISIKRTWQVYDIEWPYRFNVDAGEFPGEWKICFKIMDKNGADAVYGVGFKTISKDERKR